MTARWGTLLPVGDLGTGLDEDPDQGLETAPPAPGGGAETLVHHRTVLLEEMSKCIAAHQNWCLKEGGGAGEREKRERADKSVRALERN